MQFVDTRLNAPKTLVTDDGRQFKSFVVDAQIEQSYTALTSNVRRTLNTDIIPSVPRVKEEIERTNGDAHLTLDNLSRRLSRLGLDFDSEQRFRQQIIRGLIVSWRNCRKDPLRWSTLLARYEASGFPITPDELRRAWYALRRREPELARYRLKRECKPRPITPIQRFLLSAHVEASKKVASEKRRPTFHEFLRALSKIPPQFLPPTREAHRFADAVLGRVQRLNRNLPSDHRLEFSDPPSVVVERERLLTPLVKRHVEVNAGQVFIETLQREIKKETALELSRNMTVELVRGIGEGAGLPADYRRSSFKLRLTNNEISEAYGVLNALYTRMRVDRDPTIFELRRELDERGYLITGHSLKVRVIAINLWRKAHAEPALKIAKSGTSIMAYALATAYEELTTEPEKLAHKMRPSRKEVAEEASELINRDIRSCHFEMYCSPSGQRENVSSRSLRRRLTAMHFADPAPSGLSARVLEDAVRTFREKFNIATTIPELEQNLANQGIKLGRSHLIERLQNEGHSFFLTRTAQCQNFCKAAVSSLHKEGVRRPSFDTIAQLSTKSGLNYSRKEVIAALTALRQKFPAISAQLHGSRSNPEIVVERYVLRDPSFRSEGIAEGGRIEILSGLSRNALRESLQALNARRVEGKQALLLVDGVAHHRELKTMELYSARLANLNDGNGWTVIERCSRELGKAIRQTGRFERSERLIWLKSLPQPDEITSGERAALRVQIEIHRLVHLTRLVTNPKPSPSDNALIQELDRSLTERFGEQHHPLRGLPRVIVEAANVGLAEVKQIQEVARASADLYLQHLDLYKAISKVLKSVRSSAKPAAPPA